MAEELPSAAVESQETGEQEEYLVANWTEAAHKRNPFSPGIRAKLIAGSFVLVALFIFLGIWLGQFNFYFAAVVVVTGLAAIFQQNKHGDPQLEIVVTTERLQIGKRIIPLTEITGFWLKEDGKNLVLYFESKKANVIPISCFYSSSNPEEIRSQLIQVLPELEPKKEHYTEKFSDYFKF